MPAEISGSHPRLTAQQRADGVIRAMHLRQVLRLGMIEGLYQSDSSLLRRLDTLSRRQRALIWLSPRAERTEALALLEQSVLDARERGLPKVAEYLEDGNRAAKGEVMRLVQRQRRRANTPNL